MADEDKWVRLVAKLNALTQDGQLVWEGPQSGYYTNGRTYKDYLANYRDKAFRLRDAMAHKDRPRRIYLDIVEPEHASESLFSIPDVVGLQDLCDSIVYQRAGIKDLLDDLLADEPRPKGSKR